MGKPAREVLLQSATSIYAVTYDAYHNRKHTLNRLDKELYEAASKTIAKELLPAKKAKEVIEEFDAELAKQKERAAKARGQPGTGVSEPCNSAATTPNANVN